MGQPVFAVFGPSSGTTSIGTIMLDADSRIIQLESMSLAPSVVLGPAPGKGSGAMPISVSESFERSLKENVSIWEKLSKL
jgi:hypothetical protein